MNFTACFISRKSTNMYPLYNGEDLTVSLSLIRGLEKKLGHKVNIANIDKYIQIRDIYDYNLDISRDVAEKSGQFLTASTVKINVPEKSLEAFTSIYAKCDRKMIVLTKKINPKKLLKWWIREGFPVKF